MPFRQSLLTLFGRVTLRALAVTVCLFVGTFLPVRMIEPSYPSSGESPKLLTGPEGVAYIEQRSRVDAAFREGLLRAGARAKSIEQATASQAVFIARSPSRPRQYSLLEWIAGRFSLLADSYTAYEGDLVHVITELSVNSNESSALFNSYVHDAASGVSGSADVKIWLHEDPATNDAEILSSSFACLTPQHGGSDGWSVFSAVANAQTHHDGIDCNDTQGMNNAYGQKHMDIVRNAVRGLLPGAFACAIAGPGWFLCMGMTFAWGYSGGVMWEAIDMIWDCRCLYMGIGCDGNAPPI